MTTDGEGREETIWEAFDRVLEEHGPIEIPDARKQIQEKVEAAIAEAFEAGWKRCDYYRETFQYTNIPCDKKAAFDDWKCSGPDRIAYADIVSLVNKHFWKLLA